MIKKNHFATGSDFVLKVVNFVLAQTPFAGQF